MSNSPIAQVFRRLAPLGVGLLASGAAAAATLPQALAQAWTNNATLQAERDSLQAAGDRVDQAHGGYYPQVKLFGGVGTSHNDVGFMPIPGFSLPLDNFSLNTRQVGVQLDQALYAGGRISSGVSEAENRRAAEEAKLHAVEQDVLLDAATAYMDVLQSQAVKELETSNVKLLQQALDAAQASFDNGEVTHTDVDQAKARLAGAQAALIQAQGALSSAQASYERVMGVAPDTLQQPEPLTGLPGTQEEVLQLAARDYRVQAAKYTSAAAHDSADVAEGSLKPSVTLTGQISKSHEPQFLFERLDTRSIMLEFSMPLYSGGSLSSQLKGAQHEADSSEQQAVDAGRSARDRAIQAWQGYQTAVAGLAAISVEITAAQSAYEGVQAEYRVGDRTTLDVLNAEQELLNAKVNQVKAQRDETVAEYALKAATGSLTAADLKLPVSAPGAAE